MKVKMSGNMESVNIIYEDDLTKVSKALFETLFINNIHIDESIINIKEDILSDFGGLLKKILLQNEGLSNESKLNIINLLDKLNTQNEYFEMIKSNIATSDIKKAAERLSAKSQSAFELK